MAMKKSVKWRPPWLFRTGVALISFIVLLALSPLVIISWIIKGKPLIKMIKAYFKIPFEAAKTYVKI